MPSINEFPNRTVDCANDLDLIMAFSKVVHFLEVLPHINDEEGNRIITYDEIMVFRKVFEPKFDKILKELVRRYNLKIEDLNVKASEKESSSDSPTKRTKVTVWFTDPSIGK